MSSHQLNTNKPRALKFRHFCYSAIRKQKLDSSKDDLDLLGDPEVEDTFSGSHEDLKNAAEQLYTSKPPAITF